MYQGLQSSKRDNQLKTWILIVLLPVFLGAGVFVVFYFLNTKNGNSGSQALNLALGDTGEILTLLVPILVVWLLISFFFQKSLMFSFSGAKEVTRKEEPEIYNIVENLCISRGLPTPKIWIIESEGMNAFALGWRASDSWVVFTRGLLNHLNKAEIEAVAAHELTHIINKDSLLMLVMVLYIWAIAMLGEILIRAWSRRDNEKGNVLPLVGVVLMVLGYLVYPLIRLAISRKREFLVDAGSVELTKDNQAMISALRKISQEPEVDVKNKEMSAMFIANPLGKVSSWFQTHPSIEDRIKALESY